MNSPTLNRIERACTDLARDGRTIAVAEPVGTLRSTIYRNADFRASSNTTARALRVKRSLRSPKNSSHLARTSRCSLASSATAAGNSDDLAVAEPSSGQTQTRARLAYENTLIETINGLCKPECVRTTIFHDGPFKTITDVKHATAGWVDWYNHRRLHTSLGMVSPDKYKDAYYSPHRESLLVYKRHRILVDSG